MLAPRETGACGTPPLSHFPSDDAKLDGEKGHLAIPATTLVSERIAIEVVEDIDGYAQLELHPVEVHVGTEKSNE